MKSGAEKTPEIREEITVTIPIGRLEASLNNVRDELIRFGQVEQGNRVTENNIPTLITRVGTHLGWLYELIERTKRTPRPPASGGNKDDVKTNPI